MLSGVKYTKKFEVGGMHCEHCKNRVEEAVNDIKGVAGRVDLKKGELTVSYAEDAPDEIIKAKIEKRVIQLLIKSKKIALLWSKVADIEFRMRIGEKPILFSFCPQIFSPSLASRDIIPL